MTRDEKLMQFMDGELSPAEMRQFEGELAEHDSAQLESLKLVGDAVRDDIEAHLRSAEPDFDKLWARIDHQLESEESLRPRVAEQQKTGLWSWFSKHWQVPVTACASAAMGAILATNMAAQPKEQFVVADAASSSNASSSLTPDTKLAALPYEAPEVESLEVSNGSGTVFTIPGDEDQDGGTIIWVSLDESATGNQDPI